MQFTRHRRPWSMNEINRLYSEYENKELTIATIAKLHERSENAILYKLSQEQLILESWGDVKGWGGFEKYAEEDEETGSETGSDEEEDEDEEEEDSEYEYESEPDDESEPELDEEFDPYSIPQKVSALGKIVDTIKFFIFAR